MNVNVIKLIEYRVEQRNLIRTYTSIKTQAAWKVRLILLLFYLEVLFWNNYVCLEYSNTILHTFQDFFPFSLLPCPAQQYLLRPLSGF